MSEAEFPTGGYRNEGLRNERDPVIDDKDRLPKQQAANPVPKQLPQSELGANEMSKAWARESYRADYGRASQDNRNDFGTKRVEDEDQNRLTYGAACSETGRSKR